MGDDRTPSGLRRLESDEARVHDNTDRHYGDSSEVGGTRTRGGGSEALREPGTDAGRCIQA
jgi:hypothetical protein